MPFSALLDVPPTLMWEHQGKCPCGRRSYLFGRCPKCLQEDCDLKAAEEAEVQHEPLLDEEPVALELTELRRGTTTFARCPAYAVGA